MLFTPLGIQGVWLAESPIWSDNRGFLREWFRSEEIKNATGCDFQVMQGNISMSSLGTLRGIHYSIAAGGQAKWITCASGAIKDIVVDLRPDSPTFSKWIDIELTANSGKSIYVSEGLGHGFLALEDNTMVAYLISTPYSPEDEYSINPFDETLGIEWDMRPEKLIVSSRDLASPTLDFQRINCKLPKMKIDE